MSLHATKRSYKPAWPLVKVISTIEQSAGHQLDPKLVALFIDNVAQFEAIQFANPSEAVAASQ